MTHQGSRYNTLAIDTSPNDDVDLKVFYIGDEEGRIMRRLSPSNKWKNGAVLSQHEVFDKER